MDNHQINGETKVFGIVGNPVSHSLSPLIHNAAFRQNRFNGVYVPFHTTRVSAPLGQSMGAMGIQGLSVTIPHKTWARKVADRVDDLSRFCNASNTLKFHSDGTIEAFNTDGPGAIRALKTVLKRTGGKRYLILGYGGSASAIAAALLLNENPSLVAIYGRNKKKRDRFVSELKAIEGTRSSILSTDLSDFKPEDIDVIINTTPMGMKGGPEGLPLPEEFIKNFHIVFDIVYTPARTPLLDLAERRGARTVQGYLMLLYQATIQFEIFTGEKAPVHLMEKELLKALKKKG